MTNGFGSGGFGSQGDSGQSNSGFGAQAGSGGWGAAPSENDNSGNAGGFGSGDSSFGQSSGSFGQAPNSFGQTPNSFGGGSGFDQGGFEQNGFGNDAPTSAFAPQGDSANAGQVDTGAGASTGPLKFGTGPWHWVITAIGCAVVGLILGIVAYFTASSASSFTSTTFKAMAFAGWVIGGILTFIFLGLHVVEDNKRRASGPYIENATQVLLYRVAACVGLIAIVVTAIEIALVFAK